MDYDVRRVCLVCERKVLAPLLDARVESMLLDGRAVEEVASLLE